MKKIVVSKQRQSREYLSNPHSNKSLSERQNKSGCISYTKDVKYKDLGNGYSKIISKKNSKWNCSTYFGRCFFHAHF